MKKYQESGFALVALVTLLPVFLISLFGLIWLKAWLQPQQEVMQICRSQLLKTLNENSEKIQKLVQFNEKVILLREQRAFAEVNLRIAIASESPIAMQIAELKLQDVLEKQQILIALQNSLKEEISTSLLMGKLLTERKINSAQDLTKKRYQNSFDLEAQVLFTENPQLALHASPDPSGGPPTFAYDFDFTEKQAVHISWKHHLQQINQGESSWNILPPISLAKDDGCSASLKISNLGLKAVLVRDKFSLNSLL